MKYAHIFAEVLNAPWAILDSKFDAIVSVLARCEAGERYTEEQIREVVGARKSRHDLYFLGEDGVRIEAASAELATSGASSARPKMVAVLPVYGIIMPRAGDFDISESGTSIERLSKQFRAALANSDVKAIVFDYNSPGGSVYHVDEFAKEIFDARSQKKIVAQVNPLAASAAYYLASQASEIVITPSGETGSIGVRAMHQDMSKALEQKGIKITNISAGKYKVEGNPYEPLGEDAMGFMQSRVNEYYDMFIKAVARGRDVKASDVRSGFGEGRVLGAAEAKKLGMVDRVATLDETLSRLGASADSDRAVMSLAPEQYMGDPAGQQQAAAIDVTTTASAGTTQEVHEMDETTKTAAGAATSENNIERDRCARIMQLAAMHKMTDKVGAWITAGKSIEAVQAEVLAALSKNAAPIASAPAEREGRISVIADEHDKLPKGALFGRTLRCIAGAHRYRMSPAKFASATLRDPKLATMFEASIDGQTAGTFENGGFLLPPTVSADVIELLRPRAVVRSLNPTFAPLVNGSLSMPKLTGGTIAYYIGETKAPNPSKVKGGVVKATAKKLAAVTLISNDLLRWAPISADTLVRDDGVKSIAQKEDVSFIRSIGSEFSPKGIKNWIPDANKIAANAVVNLANITIDLNKLMLAVEEGNSGMQRCGWIMSPRLKYFLMSIRDGNGNYAFKDEMKSGTLMGYPFRSTTQIPKNLGAGTESELYFGDFADVVITDAPEIAVEISTEAAIDDGSGNLISIFSTDQSALRLIVEHDLIVRHPESLAMLTAVTWGA